MRIILLTVLLSSGIFARAQEKLSLQGTWHVKLDPKDTGLQAAWFHESFTTPISLPGTLDAAGMGDPSPLRTDELTRDVLLQLTRKHRYAGAAWYSKEVVIPADWKDKYIELFLERVIWNTRVWVDGKEAGKGESLIAPHRFDLSTLLSPGKHRIVIRIDNRKQYDISYKDMAHAYTDGTQIIWNGVIGKVELTAKNQLHIQHVRTEPHVRDKSVTVSTTLRNRQKKARKGRLQVEITDNTGRVIVSRTERTRVTPGESRQSMKLSLGDDAQLWDEFNHTTYTVNARFDASGATSTDRYTTSFGLREITAKNEAIYINGQQVFFRGTLECNIFPLTGHPPMDKSGWYKVFQTAKQYGLNHIRFHSWCPPKAAFEAADELGVYLQVELPLWSLVVGEDESTCRFLEEEAIRISEEYGNHPSFCLWALGNELQGDFEWMNQLRDRLKAMDSRPLYTTTTFTFQKGHGTQPEPGDEFFITQYTDKGWVRGQGIFNSYPPNFSTDYSKAIDSLSVPLITHEIGQYAVYPNPEEIKKYTGVLDPLNFKAIRHDLQKKDLLHLAPSFTLASGKFSANLYKEEIERALKTKGISGFQLLDLHDFPGQGTALVGILDAFWDSKGLVTAEEHYNYSGPVVPLIRFPKATYTQGERFEATAEIANFSGGSLADSSPEWCVKDENGDVLFSGKLPTQDIPTGNGISLGSFGFDLGTVTTAKALTIELGLKSTGYTNHWTIWVYPENVPTETGDAIFTRSVNDALQYLDQGKKVLLNPDTANIRGVEGRFAPVFWSPVHFPDQPGTMGILCDPRHPALNAFPTDAYSNWQWWDLITRSKTMVIDSLPPLEPVVRVIDNFFKNRKMANIIEARVGKGSLVLVSVDIANDLEKRPAARQLRHSLLRYMNSKAFTPETTLTSTDLDYLVK